jgi:hypothetical protein
MMMEMTEVQRQRQQDLHQQQVQRQADQQRRRLQQARADWTWWSKSSSDIFFKRIWSMFLLSGQYKI